MKTIAIRVSDDEHKLFTDLAEREFMPLSVLVRRTLHAEAVRVGLTLDPTIEAKRALKAEVVQVEGQEPAAPVFGLNEDGSINHRARVARARGFAKEGMPKVQVAKAMGLTLEQIEASCIEVAKGGEYSGVLPWHSSERAFALERMRSNPHYPIPPDA
jgi:hypothetical protein